MRMLRLVFKRERALPMVALLAASATSVGLVLARIIWTGNVHYGFLVWNLFLAWLPLVFALLAAERYEEHGRRSWGFLGLAGAWLLFFPNAPYIFTDLIHLTAGFGRHFWVDLALFLLCALTGLVLGFVSLYLMHGVVRRMAGWLAGWAFILAVAGLSSVGIYLGRFLRFNSWDVFFQPMEVCREIGNWVTNPLAHSTSYAFPPLFATFLFLAYFMLYALTHLQPARPLELARVQTPKAAL